MNLQKELNELYDARTCKDSSIFQKYFVEKMKKELDSMRYAYSCDTLKELNRLKGKREGLKYFFTLLKNIDEDIKIKENQLRSDSEE